MMNTFSCVCMFSLLSLHFLLGLFFLIMSFVSCLYILVINPLSVISFASVFSCSVGCPLMLSLVSFVVQKLSSLIRSNLFMFVFVSFALGNRSKKLPMIYVKECCACIFKEFYSF